MKIVAVLPCYRVKGQILDVLARVGPECAGIIVVDDACPEETGAHVEAHVTDPRVTVLRHEVNQGVGGAVVTGYRAALDAGADIVVKIDGDGQMDPALLPRFVAPILACEADYIKGNRFYSLANLRDMPGARLAGNAVLSFITKLSSGYWSIFDPTNGYTAIHTTALRALNLDRLSRRYFFESDMLVQLGGVRALVEDMPMDAVYGDEKSGVSLLRSIPEFTAKHIKSYFKRVFYNYFLRDFNMASLYLVFGSALFIFGVMFGIISWAGSIETGVPATTGTVMIAALSVILGFQMLLFFLSFDIGNEPRIPLQRRLTRP